MLGMGRERGWGWRVRAFREEGRLVPRQALNRAREVVETLKKWRSFYRTGGTGGKRMLAFLAAERWTIDLEVVTVEPRPRRSREEPFGRDVECAAISRIWAIDLEVVTVGDSRDP